jgi:hypothetical protein
MTETLTKPSLVDFDPQTGHIDVNGVYTGWLLPEEAAPHAVRLDDDLYAVYVTAFAHEGFEAEGMQCVAYLNGTGLPWPLYGVLTYKQSRLGPPICSFAFLTQDVGEGLPVRDDRKTWEGRAIQDLHGNRWTDGEDDTHTADGRIKPGIIVSPPDALGPDRRIKAEYQQEGMTYSLTLPTNYDGE